jgi:hypothetical protein
MKITTGKKPKPEIANRDYTHASKCPIMAAIRIAKDDEWIKIEFDNHRKLTAKRTNIMSAYRRLILKGIKVSTRTDGENILWIHVEHTAA